MSLVCTIPTCRSVHAVLAACSGRSVCLCLAVRNIILVNEMNPGVYITLKPMYAILSYLFILLPP